ncbi:MAG: DUF4389 domain-containing protein [Proteobacteria bacterium]|nr:DUF4389 domain-containing protein [Pseudomonadota bacterium]
MANIEKTEAHDEGEKKGAHIKDRLKDMKENIAENIKSKTEDIKSKMHLGEKAKSSWIKALYILFFIIATYIAAFVTFFVIIFQFIGELIFKKPNEHLQNFGETLGLYFCSVVRFITSSSDEMPFPFKPWPKSTEKHKH